VKRFPNLLACRAAFVEPPRAHRDVPPVRIALPNGRSVTSDSRDVDRTLSAYFRRDVRLARVAPDDFTVDMYHPDVEGADPRGYRDTVVAQQLGSALFAALGMESPVPGGAFFDVCPLSVMTTSTLAWLNELRPQSRFEPRRFRMNIIVSTERPGFVENGWVGQELGLGDGARITVALLTARCVMTTLAQEDLPPDSDVLRTLVQHNRMPIGRDLHPARDVGQFPCAGVYAVVTAPGTVRTGDHVTLV
jgi:MOSC domain-containing protein